MAFWGLSLCKNTLGRKNILSQILGLKGEREAIGWSDKKKKEKPEKFHPLGPAGHGGAFRDLC